MQKNSSRFQASITKYHTYVRFKSEIDTLTVLEATGVVKAMFPTKPLKENSSLPLPSFCGPRHSLAC